MSQRRGKVSTLCASIGVLLVIGVLGMGFRSELTVRYHLYRIESDRSYLESLYESEVHSRERAAVDRFASTAHGKEAWLLIRPRPPT